MARAPRDERGRSARGRPRETTERVPVAMPEEPRNAAWLRQFRPSGFALMSLGLVVAALLVLAPSLKTFFEQRQQIAQLEESVRQAEERVDELNDEIARWEDPAYIESQARDRLFYVYPGDQTFLVIGDDGTTRPADDLPISDEIQTTRVDWLRTLLGSVYEAGLTDATPDDLNHLDSPQQTGEEPVE